jgi:hypothetical protein
MNKLSALGIFSALLVSTNLAPVSAQQTQLLWGDTHLHTNLSADAYLNRNTTVTPDDAFRFAKGAPVIGSVSRAKVQLRTPLDFLVVTDHAEYVGIPKMLWENDARLADSEAGKRFVKMIADGNGTDVFFELIAGVNKNTPIADLNSQPLRKSFWAESVDAAENHNEPGKFTAFIGWEWSSIPNGQNLHRIVFLPEGADVAKMFLPFSAFDSDIEREFWAWLDKTSGETGANFVSIPHNSNISDGLMFPENDRAGNPITAQYARTRMRWEPVVEMTQIKGDSETHPSVSPSDQFAEFGTYEHLIKTDDSSGTEVGGDPRLGSYARPALKRGLQIEQKVGVNPFKFGMIGSTDSHSGLSTAEEDNFWGKFSIDSTPENKKSPQIAPGAVGWDMNAAGMAAVWATENTRQSIADAFRRREVYATSGPRIQLRFFGGYDFQVQDAGARDLAAVGYAKGVPMGGDLTNAPAGKPPVFLIDAVKDPKHANLDRVQVVKGWLDANGRSHEKIHDVIWSTNGRMGGVGTEVASIGSTVDLATGLFSNTIGDPRLATVWADPDFDASQRAFYYVRVIQIPTPRNSTYDAIALGLDPRETGRAITIQERAYSSPIWYTPSN